MRIARAALIAILFASTPVLAAPTVTISAPASGYRAAGDINVAANISSTAPITGTIAKIGSATQPLTGAPFAAGTFPIASLPWGPTTLTVTATDAVGASGSATIPITIDRPPTVTISSPSASWAGATISIAASCADDNPAGCTRMTALIESTEVATGTTSISKGVAAGSWSGTSVWLHVDGVDSAGQTTRQSKRILVGVTPMVVKHATAPGKVLDFDGTRVLYAAGATKVRVLSTGVDTTISTGVAESGTLLLDGRAAIQLTDGAYEWDGATLTKRGARYAAAGSLALFADRRDNISSVALRDVSAGTTLHSQTFDAAAIPTRYVGAIAVGNGDACWIVNMMVGSLLRCYRAGAATDIATLTPRVTFTAGDGLATDGQNVAFRGSDGSAYAGIVTTSGSVVTLCSGANCTVPVVEGGWTGFNVVSIPEPSVVWRRSPGGVQQKVSGTAPANVDAVSSTGQVVYSGKWLSTDPASAPIFLGLASGRTIRRGGEFYILDEDTVWRHGTPPTPEDAGVDATPDSASADTSTGDAPADTSASDTSMSEAAVADASDPADSNVDQNPPEDSSGCAVTHAASNHGVGVAGILLGLALVRRRRASIS